MNGISIEEKKVTSVNAGGVKSALNHFKPSDPRFALFFPTSLSFLRAKNSLYKKKEIKPFLSFFH